MSKEISRLEEIVEEQARLINTLHESLDKLSKRIYELELVDFHIKAHRKIELMRKNDKS